MRDSRDDMRDSESKGKFDLSNVPIWVHILIIGIIAAVVIFSVVKLVIWNAGTAELDRSDNGSFEVEVLDQIFLLSDDKKEGHTFDDEETILFLGNDAITFDQGETSITAQVSSKLGANCINCGYPASTVALKNASYSDDYPMDAYSFFNVANCIASGDYSTLESNAGKFEDYTFTGSTDRLKNVDFDKVDTIVIYYNAQDYMNLRIGMNNITVLLRVPALNRCRIRQVGKARRVLIARLHFQFRKIDGSNIDARRSAGLHSVRLQAKRNELLGQTMRSKLPYSSAFRIFATDEESSVQECACRQNNDFRRKFCAHRHANTGNFGFSERYFGDKILPNI